MLSAVQKTSNPSAENNKRPAPGVEAIFLTADPEEDPGGSVGQELWRQQSKQGGAVGTGSSTINRNKSASREGRRLSAEKGIAADVNQPDAVISIKQPSERTPVETWENEDETESPPVSWRHPLRKYRSANDVNQEGSEPPSRVSSAATSIRRRSISVTQYTGSSLTDGEDVDPPSRRSSAASIVISLSRPDSPSFHQEILQNGDERPGSPQWQTDEFRRIHSAATTVTLVAKLKTHDNLHPECGTDGSRRSRTRRNSSPIISRSALHQQLEGSAKSRLENELASRTKSSSADTIRRRRRSSAGSIHRGYFMPASRPSSAIALAEAMQPEQSRRSSSASIGALGKVSRPWTPAHSPSGSSRIGPEGSGTPSRNNVMLIRARSQASMAAPLQALNQKVNNILGCAANILDFYHLRPANSKKDMDPRRNERLVKSVAMNKQRLSAMTCQSAQERLARFRRQRAKELRLHSSNTAAHPSIPSQARRLSGRISALKNGTLNTNKLTVKGSANTVGLEASLQPSTSVSGSVTPIKKKGFALLKTLLSNRGTVAVAEAFTGRSLPLPAKVKMSKAIKRNKQVFKMRQSKAQQASNTASANTGPPTLVNFFKRGMQTRSSKKENDRTPIKYETFTDKDRAAAVLLGESDIKMTLEKQLKSERGRYVMPKESPAQVYLAQADFEMRIGGLATARGLLDKALELQPGDKNALCSRSRCRLMMGDARGALDDAEEALTHDSHCVKATYQKAEVLYQMGRFEEALVFYHMGGKQRPDMDIFHQGVRKAQEAIEISLGVKQPTLQHQQQQRTTVIPRKKKPGELPASMVVSSTRMPRLNLNASAKSSSTSAARRETSLLGDLHVDKIYFEKLLQNPGLRHATGPTQKIINHAKETLEYLKSRENFWRQQQPSNIIYPAANKPKQMKPKRRGGRQGATSRTNLTSSSASGSGTGRERRQTSSKGSHTNDSPGSLTDRAVSSSHSSHGGRSSPGGTAEDDAIQREKNEQAQVDEMYQIMQEMIEHYEHKQINRCVQTYLKKFLPGPQETDKLAAEIDQTMNKLQLHKAEEDQAVHQQDGGGGQQQPSDRIYDKMSLALRIAQLCLASGKGNMAKITARQCLQLAQETGNPIGVAQVYLLMASLAAESGDSTELGKCLTLARQTLEGVIIVVNESN